MVDRDVFGRRLAKLEELLRDLRGLGSQSREVYLGDRGLQAQAERWLHLAAEGVLDLAHHLIAERGWRTPTTYSEAIRTLTEEGVLERSLGAQIEGWARLRNVLVHMYLDIDHQRLWEILTEELDQLEAYAATLARFIECAE